jgi:hypothetical protein
MTRDWYKTSSLLLLLHCIAERLLTSRLDIYHLLTCLGGSPSCLATRAQDQKQHTGQPGPRRVTTARDVLRKHLPSTHPVACFAFLFIFCPSASAYPSHAPGWLDDWLAWDNFNQPCPEDSTMATHTALSPQAHDMNVRIVAKGCAAPAQALSDLALKGLSARCNVV